MKSTIKRWGNSAVRIPRQILSQANLESGDEVEMVLNSEGEITLRAVRQRKRIREIFAGYDGEALKSEELDWGEPQGEEIW